MFKDLSPKYYQNNKEKPEKRFMKDIKVFLKEKRERKTNKKQKIVEYTKTYKMRKRIYYNDKKRFSNGIKLLGNHGKFIYFLSAFRKFAMQTKSTVLPSYENFYA